MKNALLNTKVQASYITFLAFLPLLFTLIYTHSLFNTQINKEESLELAMKYFIQNESYLAPEKQVLTPKQSSKIAPSKKTQAKSLNETASLTPKQSEESTLNKIQEAIQKAQIYPPIAQKKRMSGVVKVEFMWMSDKTLADLKIVQSSGYTLLDKSALESIRKASLNFPSYERNLKITLPISYEIKSL
ncbi:energy transducer TonB [Campylobacter upsaliensis]|uniref:energy transducer TonB n=1 Tax=Campylobacter upsaliensis TaxID=28080 RepID=UPI00128515E6|nr:energy transducer TonB [Campylobacter upsaliensis]EAH7596854.1 energy transducer TonB [Campylobacter upsaliensis]EAJ7389472.1 energy transducer TonB [Campylobacter upsaliensis]EAJ9382961.1 energy transducer TonB [Campylobacter upsaliensis]EDP6824705.1 TonB family protein [Campylobacter upsaliensis]EKO7624166.1 energy transducer TonB [Campylobacter upsaliensis]